MSKEKIHIFDTTLRDGAQTQGVDFSIDDKLKIAKALDDLGVDYIEGGWPGANPTDTEFFQKKIKLNNSILTAFGMTKRSGRSADKPVSFSALRPDLFVIPKDVSFEFLKSCFFWKNSVSVGLAPGHPASM